MAFRITKDCWNCALCEDECPNGAICEEDGVRIIDPQKCNGCGACKEACPADTIIEIEKAPHFSDNAEKTLVQPILAWTPVNKESNTVAWTPKATETILSNASNNETKNQKLVVDNQLLKMYYLFLSVDEPMSERNGLKFNQIGETIADFEKNKTKVINECEQMLENRNDRINVVFDWMTKFVDENTISDDNGYYWEMSDKLFKGKKSQLENLWIIVCLALYDGNYSADEQKILNMLIQKWNIDKSVFLEMEDTALTLYEMDNYRNWLKLTGEPYDLVNSLLSELDKNQKDISENISEIIFVDD
jgi:Fe-S-cluster-containing hydrogenase component 2